MNTLTPYSDRWRAETRARMAALNINRRDVTRETGLNYVDVCSSLNGGSRPDHEITGPIDELLDTLEEKAESEALAEEYVVHHPGMGSPRVRRVDVDLGPLAGCDVQLATRPYVPRSPLPLPAAVEREPARPFGDGDERREWRPR
jgi:hypothetical protein